LGASTQQSYKNQYYLYRREIQGTYDIQKFASFLPWQSDLNNMPILTIQRNFREDVALAIAIHDFNRVGHDGGQIIG
jgi:hypothetical protein